MAGVVASVKANFVPIPGDMKAGTATVRHRGNRLDGGRRKLDFRCSVWVPECLKGDLLAGSKTSRPDKAGEGFLQRRSFFFISSRHVLDGTRRG